MTKLDDVRAEHVLAAMAEHDAIGREAFLERYGFGVARHYVLWREDRSYDSKAILGVAQRYASGVAAGSSEFSGGAAGAGAVLQRLGFEIRGAWSDDDQEVRSIRPSSVELPQPGDARPGDTTTTRVGSSAADLAGWIAKLGDATAAHRPVELDTLDRSVMDGPGLYSWFVDDSGADDLSRGLGAAVSPGLVYVGLTGATRWPSGRASGSTLRKRICSQHLRGRRSGSTLRRTLGAVLDATYDRVVEREALSRWMADHLSVVPIISADPHSLADLERQVVQALDPPLNLDHVGASAVRSSLTRLRASSALLDVT